MNKLLICWQNWQFGMKIFNLMSNKVWSNSIIFENLSHQLSRSCSLWYQVFYTSLHISWGQNQVVLKWHEHMCFPESNQTRKTRVHCYLGNSLWVGKATILWSLRACSNNSFREWEWSCDDLPANKESSKVWKLILFDSSCWGSQRAAAITGWTHTNTHIHN